MAQTVMPNVLTDEQMNALTGSGMPDVLTDEQISSYGRPAKKPGFLQGIIQSVAEPFLKATTGAIRTGQSIKALATGDAEGFRGASLDKPVNYGYLGKQEAFGQKGGFRSNVSEGLGAGLEVVSNIPVVRGAGAAARLGLRGFVKEGAKTGVKEGAFGGALFGAGEAIGEEKGVGGVVGGAVGGALGGAVGGGVLGGAIAGSGYGVRKGVQRLTGDILGDFKDRAINYINKAVRPSVSGKKSLGATDKYYDDAIDAAISINEAKPFLSFTDEAGQKVSRNPQSVRELAEAIDQTKSALYRQYHDLSVKAGEGGVRFSSQPIVSRLEGVSLDIKYSPETRRYARQLMGEIMELDGATPEIIESRIKDLNSSLVGYYAGRVEKSQAQLDASVANLMRENLDNIIDQAGGAGYQVLRNRYGALKTIEKDIIKRAIVDARKNAKGLLDITDIFSGGNVVHGLLTLDPTSVVVGVSQKALASIYKALNNPDRYVTNLFRLIDSVSQNAQKRGINLRETILPRSRLLLPSGKPGPQQQVNTPIQLPQETGTRREAREIARLSSKKKDLFGAVAGVEQDDEGKLTFSPEKALMGATVMGSSRTKQGQRIFKGFQDLTTKILDKLKGRSTVSKQFISDLTNSPDLKQAERDLIRGVVNDFGDDVPVQDFANKVKTELLPLDYRDASHTRGDGGYRYENITLPDELRGPVANYQERIYESPIKTSAGDVHFSSQTKAGSPVNYFAHTRIEDLAPDGVAKELRGVRNEDLMGIVGTIEPGSTRRVIEIQSDLFQKGRLEGEKFELGGMNKFTTGKPVIIGSFSDGFAVNSGNKKLSPTFKTREEAEKALQEVISGREAELSKLEPYRNTWHERIIREEIKQAAKDGKSKLQFPTGETAMKIEGLGQQGNMWETVGMRGGDTNLFQAPEHMKVGNEIYDGNSNWIITDVLGDGKFKAVPKRTMDEWGSIDDLKAGDPTAIETLDISGKIDTNNPIYRFYEKEVGRYLKNKYNAQLITDERGVKWWQVDVKKEQGRLPIEAFGVAPIFGTREKENERPVKRFGRNK